MVSNSKKLPCGHIFHTLCLRSWFQRQQTCPTCRLNILRTAITAPQPPQQPLNNNARPNEPAAAAQPNPFLNLLNQSGLANQQPTTSSATSTNPTPQVFPGAGMPPPFFFPSLPFMAPYTIPPPPMPQNLDQLTVEELRAMEGNERQHVEERLKLLRNVQTMLNASAALMSQYQMVLANLPPIPIQVPPTQATSAEAEQKTARDEKPSTSQVKLEDLGSEDNFQEPESNESASTSSAATSSTAQPNLSKITTLESDSKSTASSSFIANESTSPNGESEEATEIRKRRLQKFLHSD